ncbi:hypothetical protein PENCOP_c007G06760 [Penicillium coprophilum]|uniref:Aminoglycoside phosphotransferase domain-containing protein n=1 Tax=Penicillium coprophilum TaxID=36646 RepID=A0A1V6ULQ0_9EURO|nr:hypothetical protein PENCOP_c007G06760 [Penicillium coprophilum]
MSSSEDPCPACKWTPDQQRRCNYESSVRLFYGASSRRYWSLGSKFVLKEREKDPPSYEVINTHFIKENTTIPVHTTIQEWTEGENTADELWDALAKSLSDKVPEVVRSRLRDSMPSPHPWTFTHGDLTSCNIVDPTNFGLRALIDWEGSAYFPVWWEFTVAGFGLGDEDLEWKRLLLGNLANHKEARTWFLEFTSFASRSSDSNTRLKVLKECGIEEDIDI